MKITKLVLLIMNGLLLISTLLTLLKKSKKEESTGFVFKVRNINFKKLYISLILLIIISIVLILVKSIIIAIILTIISLILLIYIILLKKEKIIIENGFITWYNLLGKAKDKYDIKAITKIEENKKYNLTIYFNDKKVNLYYDLNSYNLIKSMVDNYNIEYIKNTL